MKRWPRSKAYFWQEAPFFRLLIPLVAGIVCYDRGLSLPGFLAIGLLLIAAGLFTGAAFVRRQHRPVRILTFLSLNIFLFLLAWQLCRLQDIRYDPAWFGNPDNRSDACLVRVLEAPLSREHTWKASVSVLKGLRTGKVIPLSGSAFLSVYKDGKQAPFGRGDTLILPSRWQPIKNPGNPFEFDYRTFCRRKNILFQQLAAPESIVIYAKGTAADNPALERFHDWCDGQLRHYLKDSATLGLLQAMLLGDESNFDPELRQAYSDTGVIHIVSISGSHVAVLFMLVTGCLFWLKGKRAGWIKYAVGVILVWIYVLMAGAPPSALRSAVMFTLLSFSITMAREAHPVNTLMGAGFLLLCAQPMWLFSVGFQLSFIAVLSLILFYRPLYRLLPLQGRVGRAIWSPVAASLAAEIFTAPLVVFYFHNFPLFFLFANLLSVVLVGFCALVGGMAIIAFCWAPPVAGAIAWIITGLVHAFNAAIHILQAGNPASFKYLQLSSLSLILLYAVIAGLALFLLKRIKGGLFLSLGSACLVLCLLIFSQISALQQHRLIVYNMGRKTAIEAISGRTFTLFGHDTGLRQSYMIRQANTGWGAWKDGQRDTGDVCSIRGKNILVLREGLAYDGTAAFPVSQLVIPLPLKGLSVQAVTSVFRPHMIIAAASQPPWLLKRWRDSCALAGIAFHAVSADGAFVLE